MKKVIFSSIVAVISVLLVLFLIAPCYAQVEFEDWVGQWYKGTIIDKGLVANDTGTGKLQEKLLTYAYVVSWDPGSQTYTSVLVQSDDKGDTWMDPVPYIVKVIGGTPLDYVSYGLITPEEADSNELPIEMFALIINIKGKEKNGEIKSGKVTTIGGGVIYDLGASNYFAAGESLKMKTIPAEKVPDEVVEAVNTFLAGD
jgi:hypothetical protein